MKYIISGIFTNGEQFEEIARNNKELAFLIIQMEQNRAITKGGYTITTKNGKDITGEILAAIYGKEEDA